MRHLALHGAIGLLLLPAPASAQTPPARAAVPTDCSDDRGVDRCSAEQHRRVLELFGLPPIERLRDEGGQARRVFYVDGYGRDVIAISFIRRPERDAMMLVHFPRSSGTEARPPLEALVPEAVWQELITESQLIDRDLAPAPASANVSICMHSWVYTVEAVDPPAGYTPASLRRKVQDACDGGFAERFAQLSYIRAVSLLPHCALIDSRRHRNDAMRLVACSLLSGDRSAAAAAMNAAGVLTDFSDAAELVLVRRVFDSRATLDWVGRRTGGDTGQAAQAWVVGISEARPTLFFLRGAHGLSAHRVRIEGRLRRAITGTDEANPEYEEAAVEQIWVFQPYREWAIERATVGPFVRVRQPRS